MSFFARAANLVKGGFKSIGRPSREDELRISAIEAELAKDAPVRRAAPAVKAEKTEEPAAARAPERDASGAVKRTL